MNYKQPTKQDSPQCSDPSGAPVAASDRPKRRSPFFLAIAAAIVSAAPFVMDSARLFAQQKKSEPPQPECTYRSCLNSCKARHSNTKSDDYRDCVRECMRDYWACIFRPAPKPGNE